MQCNGGACGCVPNGKPCFASSQCCSSKCMNGGCQP
jgi:hypothetical protein